MTGVGSSTPKSGQRDPHIRRVQSSAARLAAVQALYALDLEQAGDETGRLYNGSGIEPLVRAFMDGSLGSVAMIDIPDPAGIFDPTEERTPLAPPDGELFCTLARGTAAELARVDEVIRSALSAEWPWDRLESLLRAILRVAVYELLERPRTPPRVAIKEYVDLTASFYAGPERGFVNALLDRLAKQIRPEQFDPPGTQAPV